METSVNNAGGQLQENLEKLEAAEEALLNINRELEVGKKAAKESDQFWESIAGHMFMGSNAFDKIIKGATRLSEEMAESDEHAKQFALSFRRSFNLTRAFSSILKTMVTSTAKLAMMADEVTSSFAAATGFGNQYRGEIIAAGQAHRDLGIGIKQSGEAYEALLTGTTNFVHLTGEARQELAAQAAGLARLGVDLATTTELMQTFNLSLGQTQAEALKSVERIAMMGTSLGISAKQMTKDYQTSLSTLMVYGDRSIDVFEGLATAAKAAGVQVDSLLKLAGQFDTFAGAAETAGKLNAILGTQLSATELLLQTEDKRLETLIGTIQATGTAFGDMDRFTQKAIANAAGITDMNEASRIFGMNMAEFKSHRAEMAATEISQQKMRDAIQATIPIQEKLTLIFSQFAVALEPVLDGAHEFLNIVAEILESVPEGAKEIFGFSVAFGLMLKALGPVTGVLAGLIRGLGLLPIVGPPAGGILASLGAAFQAFGTIVGNPKVLAAIGAFTLAIMGIAFAYKMYADSKARSAEADAKEQEAVARQIEAYANLGDAVADIQVLRQELDAFKDISIDAKATLTNLAFISAGKAAEAGTAAIIDGRNLDIQNNLENIFKPTVEIKIDGEDVKKLFAGEIVEFNSQS